MQNRSDSSGGTDSFTETVIHVGVEHVREDIPYTYIGRPPPYVISWVRLKAVAILSYLTVSAGLASRQFSKFLLRITSIHFLSLFST